MSRAAGPRAEVVGSLLRAPELRAAKRGVRSGTPVPAGEIMATEDRAVLDAIALQERCGIDVITDGEMRRTSWIAWFGILDGFSLLPGGPGWEWKGTDDAARWTAMPFPFVTDRISASGDPAVDEYAFLKEHAAARTKYSVPAPSFARTHWHPEHSRPAYETAEELLVDVRDWTRGFVTSLHRRGDRQLSLRGDRRHRARHAGHAHLPGNAAGNWAASGGYERIAYDLFPLLHLDRLFLEYDTDRSGDFAPLRAVPKDTTVVVGLVTTKTGALEGEATLRARLDEAAAVVPMERLALSPQCGFASVESGNPLTPIEQEAKLRLVGDVARKVWS